MKPLLVFLGPSGSGKTTQATKIAEHYKLEKITTGDIVRKLIANNELSPETIEKFNKGQWVYSDEISKLVHAAIEHKIHDGLVLDGYPRTKAQLNCLESLLRVTGCSITAVIYISVPKSIARERVLGRHRSDDNDQSFENRYQLFTQNTKQVLEAMKEQGKLIEIDGTQSPEQVTADILAKLRKIMD